MSFCCQATRCPGLITENATGAVPTTDEVTGKGWTPPPRRPAFWAAGPDQGTGGQKKRKGVSANPTAETTAHRHCPLAIQHRTHEIAPRITQRCEFAEHLAGVGLVGVDEPEEVRDIFREQYRFRDGGGRQLDENHDIFDTPPGLECRKPLLATLKIPDPARQRNIDHRGPVRRGEAIGDLAGGGEHARIQRYVGLRGFVGRGRAGWRRDGGRARCFLPPAQLPPMESGGGWAVVIVSTRNPHPLAARASISIQVERPSPKFADVIPQTMPWLGERLSRLCSAVQARKAH